MPSEAIAGYRISSDKADLQLDVIHGFLSRSYWSPGIPRETVARAIANSLCFGVYQGPHQVGFARVITDHATFAYMADVFVLEPHRSRGLSKWLVREMLAHPELQGLRRWMLATRDAHGLYEQAGFQPLSAPERFMQLHRTDAYTRTPRD